MLVIVALSFFVIGGGLGYLVSSRVQEKRAQVRFDSKVMELKEIVKTQNEEVKNLKQHLADQRYRLSECEKDKRYLTEKLERLKD